MEELKYDHLVQNIRYYYVRITIGLIHGPPKASFYRVFRKFGNSDYTSSEPAKETYELQASEQPAARYIPLWYLRYAALVLTACGVLK